MITTPADLNTLYTQALEQHRAGQLAEAAATYRQILARWPNVAQVHNNLGILLCQQQQFAEARPWFEKAIALEPSLADAHNNLGNVLRLAGELEGARAQYEQVVALVPGAAEARNNLGNILSELKLLDEAVAQLEKAIALRPDYAEAHNNLGKILRDREQFEPAIAHFQQALSLRPDYVEAHYNLGLALWRAGRLDEAVRQFEQTLALDPQQAEAHCSLGVVLCNQDKLEASVAHLEQALALRPNYLEAYYCLGIARWHQNQLAEAADRFQQAIALRPNYPEALGNLGHLLREQLRLDEAEEVFERLRTLAPDSPYGPFGMATCCLVRGDYQRGWPALEARLGLPGRPMQPPLRRWMGQPLAGRTLMLITEEGFGDTFQFVRYARTLKKLGARVVLVCPAALGRILASYAHLDQLFVQGTAEELPPCDFYLPLLSVPGAVGTDATTIPGDVPYLAADRKLVDDWRRELAGVRGFKIGIVWQGSRDYLVDRWRSTPLEHFAPLARLSGVRLVSLQKGLGSEQIGRVDFPVLDLADRLDATAGPFMDTAAVIANLDLVVSVDTAIGHLAGALGAPVWLALQFSPNWRWLLDRDDTAWYPHTRLFRQTSFGDWPGVFERMAGTLQRHLTRKSSSSDWID